MSLFVTGTDTDIGKTFASVILLKALSRHLPVSYFKPIQSGEPTDFSTIQEAVPNIKIKPSTYLLRTPASPDRAAAIESKTLSIETLKKDWLNRDDSFHVVEGAGGLCVPINSHYQMIDLIADLKIPVVLVTSTCLGTINHTLLSVQAMKAKGLPIAGIVLNGDEDPGLKELLQEKTGLKVVFEIPNFFDQNHQTVDAWIETNSDLQNFLAQITDRPVKQEDPESSIWSTKDKDSVWHPFTQHGIVKNHPVVDSANGSYLTVEGRSVLDGISSWWVNLLGHCHPEISQAIHQQSQTLEHVIFAGFSHRPAIALSEALLQVAQSRGANVNKAFFSDNGSTAVEVALKMAYQYHRQSDKKEKNRFLAFRGSYHGDTLGAMSVGERQGFNDVFRPLMFDVDFVDPFDTSAVEKAFADNGNKYAAAIFEPMVQGASGMRMYPVETLDLLEDLCNQHEVLKICDEVFTGFYRTGCFFGFEHSQIKPDFVCLSKGLTGGFLPLAVTLTSDRLYERFHGDDMRQAFLHGHSYTANPISCAAALATLKLLQTETVQSKIRDIEVWTQQSVAELMETGLFFRGRTLGTIGAVDVSDEDPNYFRGDFSYRFNQAALKRGVLLRPLGGTVYSVPPYSIEKAELEKIYHTMYEVLKEEF